MCGWAHCNHKNPYKCQKKGEPESESKGQGTEPAGKKRAEINGITKTGQRCTKRAAEPETDENRETEGSTEQLNKKHRELQRMRMGKGKEREKRAERRRVARGEKDR